MLHFTNKGRRVVQDLGNKTVGSVGSNPNNKAGHVLVDASFTDATDTSLHFWNLAADANDDVSHLNPINLTNNGSTAFTGTNILGSTNSAANLDGSNDYFSSTSAGLNLTANTAFTIGGWFKATDWTPASARTLFTIGDSTDAAIRADLQTTGNLIFVGTNSAGSYDVTVSVVNPGFTDDTWHHFVMVYERSTLLLKVYIDGQLVGSATLANQRAATTPLFTIGVEVTSATPAQFWLGAIEDFFFVQDLAYTQDEVRRVYSSRYSHSMGTALFFPYLIVTNDNQTSVKNSGDHVVHQSSTNLFAIHDTLGSTDVVRYLLMDMT
jgi:hypothetical protein